MHTAVTQVFDPGSPTVSSQQDSGGVGDIVAAPINAVSGAIGSSPHVTLWGLVLFLVALWALVRIAGFRFVITTGVG